MDRTSRRRLIGCSIVLGILVLAGALLLVSRSLATVYTDWQWFASLGQLDVYQTRLWTRVALWLVGALLTLIVLGLNWFVIPRGILDQLRLRLHNRQRRMDVTLGSTAVVVIMGLAIAAVVLVMASQMSRQWLTLLTFRHAVPFGMSEDIFGLDASFYVFKLPLYRFTVTWSLALVILALVGSALVYLAARQRNEKNLAAHLSVLAALFLALKAVDYWLQRYTLLNASHGVVFGAGYTDVHARLPFLNLLAGVAILGALLMLANAFVRRGKVLLGVGGVWLAASLLGLLYPAMVQRFAVQPNELAMERPYIERNIQFTRYAYGLEDVLESDYEVAGMLTAAQLQANADILDNVRLWDWQPLRTTYEQLQEIRTYYTFIDVDVDRYVLDGRLREVNLAVREMDVEQLREDARTWINQHLIYTHGYGLCLSPVSAISEEGLPYLLVRDVPPRVAEGADPTLALTRPEVYFGEATTNYAIVNTGEDEFDYPQGDQNVYTRYEGPDGVPIDGFLRRLAFAVRFESAPILFSRAITAESRILFHRTLADRVEMLAPMLWYDDDPYPVIVDGRIVWLYDAYTWSNRFPYSEPTWGLNYARNSVKVAVDAYTGETTFYVIDPSDPLVQAYRAIFPDLFVDGEEMDAALREHWRYPEQLFLIQAEIYGAYHMQDARVFYNQEDLWQTPTEIRDLGETWMTPYYVVTRLPDAGGAEQEVEFIMMRPYVPAGKQNMIAWLYADSDGADYGQMGVFKFSKETLVYGPIQVEARINQDPFISQQLALWDQRGSSVIRGNLIVLPIDGTLLYVEPLYLQAESGRLPELKRVLVAHGNQVAMANDLAAALAQVTGEAPEVTPAEPLSDDASALASSALAHYQAAQVCLQQGDWACYGAEMEALAADLEALTAALGEPPAD